MLVQKESNGTEVDRAEIVAGASGGRCFLVRVRNSNADGGGLFPEEPALDQSQMSETRRFEELRR